MKQLSALCALCAVLALSSCATKSGDTVSADDAIKGVSVIGTIGMDGSKPRAIAVEYDRDLGGAKLTLDTFSVTDYGLTLSDGELNAGHDAGKPTRIYLNDSPALSEKGAKTGGSSSSS